MVDTQMVIKTDIAQVLKRFEALEPRQFPFIVSLAMNKTGKIVREGLKNNMPLSLDRPTNFTLNSLMIRPATKIKLETDVGLREFAGKGTPASKYLLPQIHGGDRKHKRFERALIESGLMPNNYYAVPGGSAPLDNYGNVRGSYITSMLSYLKSSPDSFQNRTARSSNRKSVKNQQFFVINNTDSHLPLGIYQRKATTIGLIFAFVKKPNYSKRFLMFEIAEKLTRQHIQDELYKAAEQALKTSSSKASLSDFANALEFLR